CPTLDAADAAHRAVDEDRVSGGQAQGAQVSRDLGRANRAFRGVSRGHVNAQRPTVTSPGPLSSRSGPHPLPLHQKGSAWFISLVPNAASNGLHGMKPRQRGWSDGFGQSASAGFVSSSPLLAALGTPPSPSS